MQALRKSLANGPVSVHEMGEMLWEQSNDSLKAMFRELHRIQELPKCEEQEKLLEALRKYFIVYTEYRYQLLDIIRTTK